MKHLSKEQLAVIETLASLWPELQLVLIGANGLAFSIDMRWRTTQDLDLVIALELDDFPGRLARLQDYKQELPHRWQSASGVKIDFLPCGPKSLQRGSIHFEGGDSEMNLTGFDLALDWTMMEPHLPRNVACCARPGDRAAQNDRMVRPPRGARA